MTLQTPPSWLQAGSYPAQYDRITAQALYATTGIIGSSSMAVTQNSPAGMSVRVASGWAAVIGTTTTNMGVYTAYNDATVTLTITTANPTLPRIDLVCMTIRDAYYSGANNDVIYQVIAGTAAASPVAPTLPANSISLATIAVGAAVTSILTANITDTRVAVTTNLPVGDITEVQGGTGITVTSGTGPIPSVAINSTVATLTGSQALTNKDLTSGTNTFPTSLATLTGTQTLTNKTLTTPAVNRGYMTSPKEFTTISATASTGTINFDVITQGILYYTTDATNNFTLNFRGNSGTTLSSLMNVGDAYSVVFMCTNGATPYYASAISIDGTTQTPVWASGVAPSTGNASAIDAYTIIIFKTAATPTYKVLAGVSKFA